MYENWKESSALLWNLNLFSVLHQPHLEIKPLKSGQVSTQNSTDVEAVDHFQPTIFSRLTSKNWKNTISNVLTPTKLYRLTSFLMELNSDRKIMSWAHGLKMSTCVANQRGLSQWRMISYWRKEKKQATFLCVISESAQLLTLGGSDNCPKLDNFCSR